MPRPKAADQAATIKRLMDSGHTAERIMEEHPELAGGWNEVAKTHVARQPARGAGPSEPVLNHLGSRSRHPFFS